MKDLFSVSLQEVMSPALLAVWERMSIGVAIVDADGICVFMNDIQRKVDGFSQTRVVGKHITQLYLPNELRPHHRVSAPWGTPAEEGLLV